MKLNKTVHSSGTETKVPERVGEILGIIIIFFCVHVTVHLSNTSHLNTNEMQLFFYSVYLVLELYMFRTQFSSIIRGTINRNSSHWC